MGMKPRKKETRRVSDGSKTTVASMKEGKDRVIFTRFPPVLSVPIVKAYEEKVASEDLNTRNYGLSSFVRDLAELGLEVFLNRKDKKQ